MSEEREKHPLVRALEAIAERDDRGALAALRRGLGGDGAASVYPFVAPYFPRRPDAHAEAAMMLVASLFSLHPRPGALSLGRAMREIRDATKSESVEGRFVALLNAHPDDLGEHLRHAVSLCRANEKALDWDDLLRAVLRWGHDDDSHARRRQARAFWTDANTTETE